jgi:hypothetical protein
MFAQSQGSNSFDYGTQDHTANADSMASLFGSGTRKSSFVSNPYASSTRRASLTDTEALLQLSIESFIQSKASSDSIRQLSSFQNSNHWNLSNASKLMDFIMNISKSDVVDIHIIVMLALIVPQWSASTIYSTMVYGGTDPVSMQIMLADWVLQKHHNAKRSRASLRLMAHIVASMTNSVSPDRSTLLVGLADGEIQLLAKVAMETYQETINNATKDATMRADEVACLSLLSSLSLHSITDWLVQLNDNDVSALVQSLLKNAHQTSCTDEVDDVILNMISLQLLSLIQATLPDDIDIFPDFTNMIHSTNIIEKVVRLATAPGTTPTLNQAITTIQVWSVCQDEAWVSFLSLEQDWGTTLMESWQGLCNGHVKGLPMILALHSVVTLTSKRRLDQVLSSTENGHVKLLDLIFALVQHEDTEVASQASALLRLLLNDRKHTLQHDALSRQLWAIMGGFPAESLVETIVKLSLMGPAAHSILICMMDVLEMVLQYSTDSTIFKTKQVESLIDLLSSSKTGYDPDESILEEDTPQANNLSKLMDESHFSLDELEKETGQQPRGLDRSVQLATGIVLVRMASIVDSILQKRICKAIQDYISNVKMLELGTSRDWTRRLFRLQSLLAVTGGEQEDVLAGAIFHVHQCHRQELQSRDEEITGYKNQLRDAQDRIDELSREKALLQRAVKTNAMVFERDVKKATRTAGSKAKQEAELHLGERKRAEHKLAEVMGRVSAAENRQRDVEHQLDAQNVIYQEKVEELDEAKSRIDELTRKQAEHQMKVEQCKLDTLRLMTEVDGARDYAEEMEARYKSAARRLESSQANLQAAKVAYSELQEEVESICGSLVSLSTIYQVKEEEIVNMHEVFDRKAKDAKRKVEVERSRVEELEAESDRLQRDNEKMLKKLTRVKDALEEERRDRAEEAARRKRNGPVSYINQLHSSTASEKDLTSKNPKSAKNYMNGKENSIDHRSSSRREQERISSDKSSYTSSRRRERDYEASERSRASSSSRREHSLYR